MDEITIKIEKRNKLKGKHLVLIHKRIQTLQEENKVKDKEVKTRASCTKDTTQNKLKGRSKIVTSNIFEKVSTRTIAMHRHVETPY